MHVVTVRAARRRATKRNLTPDWCRTGEAAEAIEDIYILAQLLSRITGYKFVVDHKIPLAKGGLHEPSNLTPLREDHNAQKGVRLDWQPPPPVFKSTTWVTYCGLRITYRGECDE